MRMTEEREARFTRDDEHTFDRTLAQRMTALERANEIRSARAQLKRDLKAGRTFAVDIIAHPPEWVETMHLFDLLLAVPKMGRTKVNKALLQCRISPSKTIGGLSDRQRDEVVFLLQRR